MRTFNELPDEFTGQFYQTEPLNPNDKDRLINVAAAIQTNFINSPYWEFECHKGSLTFRHHFHENCESCEKNQHKVIKIFIDYNQRLSIKEGVASFFRINYHPIAVAIELGYEDPFVRKSIRDLLRSLCGDLYLDPVTGHSKYYLDPSKHYYDIVLLGEGSCEYPIDDRLYKEISDEINSKIGQEKSNEFIIKK